MKRAIPGLVVALAILAFLLPTTAVAQQDYDASAAMRRALDSYNREAAIAAVAANPARVTEELLIKWIDATSGRPSGGAWEYDLRMALAAATPDRIYDAQQATSYKQFVDVLVNGGSLSQPSGGTSTLLASSTTVGDVGPLAIGSGSSDLVYNPVTPCRIIDTRLTSAGMIAANTNRSFGVIDGYLGSQGGAASCGIPADPKGVVITLTVTATQGPGDLRIWPYGDAMPNASVLNYQYGDLANTMIVPITQLGGLDFTIRADAHATHVVADIMGYFWSPTATAIDAVTVSSTYTIPANDINFSMTANCAAGYSMLGGGHNYVTNSGNVWIYESGPSGNGWLVRAKNANSAPETFYIYARCGRIPGR